MRGWISALHADGHATAGNPREATGMTLKNLAADQRRKTMLFTGKSAIHGTGVFTGSPIGARNKIGEYSGERISVREGRRRAKTQRCITIVEVTDKVAIDGSIRGGLFTYINHSCSPNVYMRIAYGRAE